MKRNFAALVEDPKFVLLADDFVALVEKVKNGKVKPGTYKFGDVNVRITRPISPSERVKRYYSAHPEAREKLLAYKKNQYRAKKQLKICVKCGRKVNGDYVTCQRCRS